MSALILKIIACMAMAVSHFGCIFRNFLPPVWVDLLYYTGRVSFPIFAYLITEGWQYTGSKSRYMLRLFGFALLSQIPYALAIDSVGAQNFELNVLFTLFLGTCVLWIEDRASGQQGIFGGFLFILAFLPVSLGFLFEMDFGWEGILCIGLMGLVSRKNCKLGILLAAMALIYIADFSVYYGVAFLFTLPAILLLYFYNGSRGRVKCKYMFYLFYPLHLTVLYCIYCVLC